MYIRLSFLGAALFATATASLLGAEDKHLIAAGNSINVSRYPEQMQEVNTLYEAKCSTCHGLKETYRAPGALPSYWEKTVHDMVNMANSGITQEEGNRITEFLIYDSATRRKRDVKKQLEELPEDQRAPEQAKIDAILNKFK